MTDAALLGRFGRRPTRPISASRTPRVGQIYFGVDNFDRLTGDVERLSGEFLALQDKHMQRVRYTKHWEDEHPQGLEAWKQQQALLSA